MTKIEDITGAYGLNELKKIIKSIEAFDNGEWLPAGITASVLEFLGASVLAGTGKERGYEGYGIDSGFLHPDEILAAVCLRLEEEKKISPQDIPFEASNRISNPRPSAFDLMKNAEEGAVVDTWIQDTVQSDLGGHYDIEQRITEINFGMFKIQCLWTYNRAPASIGGDNNWQNSGYRIVVA